MKRTSIAHLRREYQSEALLEKKAPRNPFKLFQHWFKEALKSKVFDANAFALATMSPRGTPSNRIVLLKGLDHRGFIFFTNYRSQKGQEISHKAVASLLFFWPELIRQVRIDGKVEKISSKESDVYFKTRPRGSQIGAWASDQSKIVPNREFLENREKELEAQYQEKTIPRPPYWGGYRVIPKSIEFWQGRPNRLHDRLRYARQSKGVWLMQRLSP